LARLAAGAQSATLDLSTGDQKFLPLPGLEFQGKGSREPTPRELMLCNAIRLGWRGLSKPLATTQPISALALDMLPTINPTFTALLSISRYPGNQKNSVRRNDHANVAADSRSGNHGTRIRPTP
jgi:hypothetical protein